VDSIVDGLGVPVDVSMPDRRFPSEIEASANFVVAEALTNVAKDSDAKHTDVIGRVEDEILRIDVCDDGVGGARADGRGLLGLRDRVVTLGGALAVDRPPGGGTRIAVTLPGAGLTAFWAATARRPPRHPRHPRPRKVDDARSPAPPRRLRPNEPKEIRDGADG